MRIKAIPIEISNNVFYEKETGFFFPSDKDVKEERIDTKMNHGYFRIRYNGIYYLAHRVAWAIMTKADIFGGIDHIDGDPSNNVWSNLRLATHHQNMQNRKKHKNNKSGFTGVTWKEERKRWRVELSSYGIKKHIGYFENIEEAKEAYEDASNLYFKEFKRIENGHL